MGRIEKMIRQAIDDAEAQIEADLSNAFVPRLLFVAALVLGLYVGWHWVLPWIADERVVKALSDFFPNDTATGKWGEFGDFVGGILNPLIAGGALFWLIRSVTIQRTELAESRRALNDSAESQRQQVDESKRIARINALSALVTTLESQITALQGELRFMAQQLVESKTPFTLEGYTADGEYLQGLRFEERQTATRTLLADKIRERDTLADELRALVSGSRHSNSPI